MTTRSRVPSPARRTAACLFAALVACLAGCATTPPNDRDQRTGGATTPPNDRDQRTGAATTPPHYRGQRTFDSPTIAATALAAAAQKGDTAELEAIFGPEARGVLSSGDPVADRRQRQVFAVAMNEGWTIESGKNGARELVVGNERWPFPIPLVKDSNGWWFDTAAGKEEVLARRIGRNELAAMGALRAYVAAQREYAGAGRDGKPAGIYAQRIRSDPRMHNGLYWPETGSEETPSPLGQFAAAASAEGYGTQKEATAPYHGYFYRILTKQGAAAPGGARNYVVKGDMTGGFAMIAFPALYGNSGIMTFLVGADGAVYEADLGPATADTAARVDAYSPDDPWRKVE